MPKTTETILEIDLKALEHNYHYLRDKLESDTKFLGVVKAFAYGSDSVIIAQKLVALGIDYFAVAYVKEGIALREAGIDTPILVLHPLEANFDALISNRLEPSLYSPKILKAFLTAVKQQGQIGYPVHIKFNTGLNRLGFWEKDIDFIKEQLEGRNEVKVKSIFSHLAASEDVAQAPFTKGQIQSFEKIAKEFVEKLKCTPLRHLLNTSGVLNYPEAHFDMVRSGIGLYGFGNDPKIDHELQPVASLKTIISQIHKIEPTESVGYNRAYVAEGYRTIATLPLGHADGIGRQYGNGKATVSVKGIKAPIIGNVCMDMIMIDITGIDCEEGDEVVIFGKDTTADTFASMANTISYELLTCISQRVKRVFI